MKPVCCFFKMIWQNVCNSYGHGFPDDKVSCFGFDKNRNLYVCRGYYIKSKEALRNLSVRKSYSGNRRQIHIHVQLAASLPHPCGKVAMTGKFLRASNRHSKSIRGRRTASGSLPNLSKTLFIGKRKQSPYSIATF